MHLISTHIAMVHTTDRNVSLVLTQIFIHIQNSTSFTVCIYTLSHLSLHPRFQICHTKSKPAIFHFKVFIHLNSCIFKERISSNNKHAILNTNCLSSDSEYARNRNRQKVYKHLRYYVNRYFTLYQHHRLANPPMLLVLFLFFSLNAVR